MRSTSIVYVSSPGTKVESHVVVLYSPALPSKLHDLVGATCGLGPLLVSDSRLSAFKADGLIDSQLTVWTSWAVPPLADEFLSSIGPIVD